MRGVGATVPARRCLRRARAFLFGVALLTATALAASGCTTGQSPEPAATTSDHAVENDCFPAAMTVTPHTVTAGTTATLSAPKTTSCTLRLGDNPHYDVSISGASGTSLVTFTTPVSPDGEFSHDFTMPADAPAGPYVAVVDGGLTYTCHDTNSNSFTVAAAVPAAEIHPVSCARYATIFLVVVG